VEPSKNLSETLALSRKLQEELQATIADSKKIVERSHQVIEQTDELIDKTKRLLNDATYLSIYEQILRTPACVQGITTDHVADVVKAADS
jgi:hypothetical protein